MDAMMGPPGILAELYQTSGPAERRLSRGPGHPYTGNHSRSQPTEWAARRGERSQHPVLDPPASPSPAESSAASPPARADERRVAIFSDVHGNLAALRAVSAALSRLKALDH